MRLCAASLRQTLARILHKELSCCRERLRQQVSEENTASIDFLAWAKKSHQKPGFLAFRFGGV